MRRLSLLLRTSVGIKALVAGTGLILYAWVTLHMLGNLKVYTGTDPSGVHHMDIYARFLRTMGEPILPMGAALWANRIVLILVAALHIWGTVTLAVRNRAARPVGYKKGLNYRRASWAARTMMISGPLLLVYVVFHILHLTTGDVRWTPFEHGAVYANLHNAFSLWFVALIYLVAVALLAFHLYHGVWSLFQTLGLDNPDRNRMLRGWALASALILFLGFASVPLGFFLGLLPDPPAATLSHEGHADASNPR